MTSQSPVIALPDTVAIGGTAATSFTPYAPLCGGTTSTGALQSASTGMSNVGYALTSNGASALPSFQYYPISSFISVGGSYAPGNTTSVPLTSIISGSYTTYVIFLTDISVATNGATIRLQVSTNNGSIWVATGYQAGKDNVSYNSTSITNTNATTYVPVLGSIDTSTYASGSYWLQNVGNGAPFMMYGTGNVTSGGVLQQVTCMATNTATTVNAVEFITSGGNMLSGYFNVFALVQ